jgi:hypothetical protein
MGKTDVRARDLTTRQQISNAIVSKRKYVVLNKIENDDLQWKGSEQGHGMGNDLKDDQRKVGIIGNEGRDYDRRDRLRSPGVATV